MRTDVRKRAEQRVTELPQYLKNGIDKNEAKVGESLFEDYLNKVVRDDETRVVCLAIPNDNSTRVWAGAQACLTSSKILSLKYVPGHGSGAQRCERDRCRSLEGLAEGAGVHIC